MIKLLLIILFASQSSVLYSQDLTPKQKNTYAWQIALDAECFSPGLIDGVWGRKTSHALQEYLNSIDYEGSVYQAKKDDAIILKLKVQESDVLTQYTITEKDVNDIGVIPKGWNERSKLKKMTYESLAELIQGKFHCSLKALKRLNPVIEFQDYGIGTVVNVPNIKPYKKVNVKKLEIDLIKKTITGFDINDSKVLLLNCSVARSKENLPKSDTFVKNKALNPNYTFNPKYWPEIKDVDRILIIQPGPKNPVGMAWISLDLSGYGMHGTPVPDNIGKTGSHGCIRLTNWHAVQLLKSVSVGIPVAMIGKNLESEDHETQSLIPESTNDEINPETKMKIQVLKGDQRLEEKK